MSLGGGVSSGVAKTAVVVVVAMVVVV